MPLCDPLPKGGISLGDQETLNSCRAHNPNVWKLLALVPNKLNKTLEVCGHCTWSLLLRRSKNWYIQFPMQLRDCYLTRWGYWKHWICFMHKHQTTGECPHKRRLCHGTQRAKLESSGKSNEGEQILVKKDKCSLLLTQACKDYTRLVSPIIVIIAKCDGGVHSHNLYLKSDNLWRPQTITCLQSLSHP